MSSQDAKTKHPIDQRLNQCHEIEENQTTYGMMQCEGNAREEWDKELNKNYNLLMDLLNTEQQELLKKTQRQWLKYRDAELNFSSDMHYGIAGTMWRIVAVQRSKEIVKQRALELGEYYETLKGNQ